MRIVITFAALGISFALGGCFYHHTQEVYIADVPPQAPVTPLK
jgi:hypothetical protein